MTKLFILLISILPAVLHAQGDRSAPAENIISAEELNTLLGEWTGSLTYVDYSSNNPYTMPANVIIKQGKNERTLLLFNVYPNEPKANGKDKVVVSRNGDQINKKAISTKTILPDGGIQYQTEYSGKDNSKKARIRNTYVIAEKQFIIRKEVRMEGSDTWKMRNEFSYTR